MVRNIGSRDRVQRKFKHSFARQYLQDHKTRVYNGDKQVLTPTGHLYNIKFPNTRFYVGEQFIEQGKPKHITKYSELKRLGFTVISIDVTPEERWETGQKIRYELRLLENTGQHLIKIPRDHYVEYDTYNKMLRLSGPRAGPNGVGYWTRKDPKKRKKGGGRKISTERLIEHADKILDEQLRTLQGLEEKPKPVYIKEAAFMVTNANEIICFPNGEDMPSILIVGMKGCLTEDTLIDMPRSILKYPEGISIKNLIGKKDFHVYSFNTQTKKLEVKKAESCEFIKKAKVYELELVNGQKIKATEDHPFLLMNGTYKKLKDLKHNTSSILRLFSKGILSGGVIKSIKLIGERKVYDIVNVKDNHNFIANGFVVSNSGKCILQDTNEDFVIDSLGRWRKISDRPNKTFHLDENFKIRKTKVKEHFKRTVKKVLEITTRTGRTIKLTPEHPLLKVSGWVPAESLVVGDYIAVPKKYNFGLKREIPIHCVKLLAHLIGCGRLAKRDIRFLHKYRDHTVEKDIENSLQAFDPNLYLIRKRMVVSKKKHSLIQYLKKVGVYGLDSKKKFIPDEIMTLCDDQIKIFLSSWFSIKGGIVIRDGIVWCDISADNKVIARQLQHLFIRLGILCRIIKVFYRKTRYILRIQHKTNIEPLFSFLKNQPVFKVRQIKEGLICLKDQQHNHRDLIPKDLWKVVKPDDWVMIDKQLGWEMVGSIERRSMNFPICMNTLKKMIKGYDNSFLKKLANADVYWDKINKIEQRKGNFKVEDMEVSSGMHNFVANDIIVHNSYCSHSLVSKFFWKPEFNYKMCILNDSSKESGTWCLPNDDRDQINILKRLNEKPLPLPCVYFHPLSRDDDSAQLYMGNVGFDITIPFREVINNDKEYFTFKDSRKYFTKIKDDLLLCKTQEQAENVIEEMTLMKNVPPNSANKIQAEFNTIFDSRITDISSKGQLPWSTSKNSEEVYNPFTAMVHAGVIPVLVSSFISQYTDLLAIYFRYFAGDLFSKQREDPDFLAEQAEIMIVVDEAHNISKKGINTGANDLLIRSVREGRPRRIGTLLITQSFKELPEIIKGNSTHLICFKNSADANEIASKYNLSKDVAAQIKDLGKHECLAYTTEHFIIYDTNGKRRRSELNEIFIGKTLPPYSQHKRPKSKD